MGKGDKKTRRGKIVNGSSGKRRHKKNKTSKVQAKKIVQKAKPASLSADKTGPAGKVKPRKVAPQAEIEQKPKVETKEKAAVKPKPKKEKAPKKEPKE